MLVHEFLEKNITENSNKVAIIFGDKRLTYLEIETMANKLANALRAHGIQRGDRVAIHLPNSIEAVVSIFAILKAGGVFVVINNTTKPDKLEYILNNCRAKGLITEQRKSSLVQKMRVKVPSMDFCLVTGLTDSTQKSHEEISTNPLLAFDSIQTTFPPDRPPHVNIDLDLACLIYTSGSTGEPKGVMSDHSNMVFAASSIREYLENTEDDIVINVLPLSFDYGLYQLLMVFKFGGTLVLERSFAYPAAILKKIENEQVTGFPGVPTIFAMLLQMDLTPYNLSSLRYITNTAAALPPSHIQQLRQKFPGVTLFSMYGLTETKRTLYLPPDQLDIRPGSVGIAIPGTEVWLENESGTRLGPGETGELVVRGRHVMRGYWDDPKATDERYRPGKISGERLCYSGDLFRMDEDGYLYFVGRKDDIIKSRGEKVAPKEVENVLYGISGVTEAAVIGVPDPILGEAIKAFIVTEDSDLTETQVLAHCRLNLEDFMIPHKVEFCTSLPKTSSGKIKKTDLR